MRCAALRGSTREGRYPHTTDWYAAEKGRKEPGTRLKKGDPKCRICWGRGEGGVCASVSDNLYNHRAEFFV